LVLSEPPTQGLDEVLIEVEAVRTWDRFSRGAAATVNAIVGGAKPTMAATADGGRLATITGDPPTPERGIAVANVHVRADGAQLAKLVGSLGTGALRVPVAAAYPLGHASEALASAASGRAGGAIVLRPPDPTA
jgi:NADPH:quinone reductase-like Zn-dependent oxidoreductase